MRILLGQQGDTYYIAGKIMDNTGQPISNASLIAKIGDQVIGITFSNDVGDYVLRANQKIPTLHVSASDCQLIEDNNVNPGNINTVSNKNYILTRLPRPTTSSITYANQNVTGLGVTSYASDNISFSNYIINSSYFNIKASRFIYINTGTEIRAGNNFTARIGSYYQDCGTISFAPLSDVTENTELINQEKIQENLLYPNPGNGHYFLNMKNEDSYSYEIFNALGAKVKSGSFSGQTSELNISEHNTEIYMLIIKDANQTAQSFKLIKE